jgi:hypothetical protein
MPCVLLVLLFFSHAAALFISPIFGKKWWRHGNLVTEESWESNNYRSGTGHQAKMSGYLVFQNQQNPWRETEEVTCKYKTTTVAVLGTGILKESASCNYYSLHYNILPRVMDNIYIQYEPSVIVVSIVDSLIWKEESDTLNGTNILVKVSKTLWILMNSSLRY